MGDPRPHGDLGASLGELMTRMGQVILAARQIADHPLAREFASPAPAAARPPGGKPPLPQTVHQVPKPDWAARKKRALDLVNGGMTQARAAYEVGVNPWTVSRWVRQAGGGRMRRSRVTATVSVG